MRCSNETANIVAGGDKGAVSVSPGLLAQYDNNWTREGVECAAELEAISLISFF